MKKLMILATILSGLIAFAQPALAEPENPIVRGSISVSVEGAGKVTGTGIDCGTDCSQTDSWPELDPVPKNRLTATADAGWAFSNWTGCSPVAGQPARCDATYGNLDIGEAEVTARFNDVQAPTVILEQPGGGTRVGDVLPVNVSSYDNYRVDKVVYLIDGQAVIEVSSDFTWEVDLDVSSVTEGEHTIQARSFDPAGNSSITTARSFNVDHTGPEINLNQPPAATNAERPQFSFGSTSPDFHAATCAIQAEGPDQLRVPCNRNEWFSADTPVEGGWTFVVQASDDVGNTTVTRHEFTVDRTAPVFEFTAGPADGSMVELGNVRYEWDVADGLAVTQACSWDGGEEKPCAGKAGRGLTAGTHTFNVTATDLAGNRTDTTRVVNVKRDGTLPDPHPGGDRTPPRIKLILTKPKPGSLARGLKLKVRCSESCTGSVKATAKGGYRFTGRIVLKRTGARKLVLKPTAKTVRRLGARTSAPRGLKLTVKAALRDQAGNLGHKSLKLTVRR